MLCDALGHAFSEMQSEFLVQLLCLVNGTLEAKFRIPGDSPKKCKTHVTLL